MYFGNFQGVSGTEDTEWEGFGKVANSDQAHFKKNFWLIIQYPNIIMCIYLWVTKCHFLEDCLVNNSRRDYFHQCDQTMVYPLCVCSCAQACAHVWLCIYTLGHVCGGQRSVSDTVNKLFWNSVFRWPGTSRPGCCPVSLPFLPRTASILSFFTWFLGIKVSLCLQGDLNLLSLLPCPRCTLFIPFLLCGQILMFSHLWYPLLMESWINVTNLPVLLCSLPRKYGTEFGDLLFESIFMSYNGQYIEVCTCSCAYTCDSLTVGLHVAPAAWAVCHRFSLVLLLFFLFTSWTIPSVCSLPVHGRHSYMSCLLGYFCLLIDFALFISWYQALNVGFCVCLAEHITSMSYNPWTITSMKFLFSNTFCCCCCFCFSR